MADFTGKSKQGGRGGGSRGFVKSPVMMASRYKKRNPGFNESHDTTMTDAGQSAVIYSSAGTHVHTVGATIDTLRIHMYGAGGGGGEKLGKVSGGGGGGGAFVGVTLSELAPGTSITFVVGAGGSTSSGAAGGTGGDTYFQWVDAGGTAHGYTAGGGGQGGAAANAANSGAAGVAQGVISSTKNPKLGSTMGATTVVLTNGGIGRGVAGTNESGRPWQAGGTGASSGHLTDYARGGSGEGSAASIAGADG